MANPSQVGVTEGASPTKNVATYSINENSSTKQIERATLNDSSGNELVGGLGDTAWDGVSSLSGLVALWKYTASKIDAVRALLAGTLTAVVNLRDGSGTAISSDTRGSKQALSVEIVDSSGNQVTSFGGAGGTSSNFASTFPNQGTAMGAKNGTNMVNVTADASGNLNVNLETALPAGTNTIGAVEMKDGAGNSLTSDVRGSKQALSVEIVDGSGNQITSFGGAGGTASNFTSTFPTQGTAIGAKNGANMVNLTADGSGNLNVNLETALPAGTNTIGAVELKDGSGNALTSDTRGAKQALSVEIVDSSGNQITTFGGAGGTASNFSSTFPTQGTAIGVQNGANMVGLTADGSNNLNVAVNVGGAAVTATNPIAVMDAYQAPSTASWTSSTAINTALTLNTSGYDTVVVTAVPGGTITAGAITFEVYDGTNWLTVKAPRTDSYTTDTVFALTGSPGTHSWQIPVAGYPQFRARLSTALTGTSPTAALVGIVSSAPDTSIVTVGLDPSQPLPAGTNLLGAVNVTEIGGSAVVTGVGAGGSGIPRVTVSNDSAVKVWDGTNSPAVKAASTAPSATDPALVVSISPNSVNANGRKTPANSAPVVMASQTYNTVAASQPGQSLTGGSGGATGDWLDFLLVIPASTSPGAVSITDGGGSAITIFAGGASSVASLVPFSIPVRANSGSGAWKVTTGANVSVVASGNFT